jgi:AbiTii
MARSQILKDLVSGDNNLESVLLRLKIILSDLENEEINNWIDSEIQGYENTEDVPSYRILQGRPIGTFILGSLFHGLKHTNAQIPLGHIPKDIKDDLLTLHLTDGLLGIKSLLESEGTIAKSVTTEFCHSISQEGLIVTGMEVVIGKNHIQGVIANIKNKLMNILLKIEKEFGNLDSLDTFAEETDTQALQSIEQYIINVIFDESIKIGDNNKIKSSAIGHRGGANVD